MAKKACIETFGCQMNVHDSERMAGLLEQAGYEITENSDEADLLVINTCSVREKAEDKLFSRLSAVGAASSQIVAVTGCVAQQESDRLFSKSENVDVVVGTQAVRRLPMLVEEARNSGSNQIDVNPYDDVSFPLGVAVRSDPGKAYINIIEGCNDYCAFCVVPYTRGHERMRPALEILREARLAASDGHSEIHLLGQIVNHYMAPDVPGCDFSSLLEMVHEIDGVKRIRFASPHPRHVNERMIRVMADLPKVCKHLHLPVQSGSTAVLQRMRRRHTRDEYLELVSSLREAIPGIALSTDMIVGFPGETEQQFEESISLAKLVRYHSMFSFKYSERPNTLASGKFADAIPDSVKSERLSILQKTQKEIQSELHSEKVGRVVEVLVDSVSRRRPTEVSGRTSGNTVVNFPGGHELIGQFRNVRVRRAGPNSLWGEVEKSDAY